MAVFSVSQWQITPGRYAEFMEGLAKSKAIHMRLGAQSIRATSTVFGGPSAGVVSFVIEHADGAAQAAWLDNVANDAEWQTYLQEVIYAADPVGVLLSNSTATEIPI